MSVDLIIYAAVAFGLAAWLRSILGTNSDSARKRVHPIVMAEMGLLSKKANDKINEDGAVKKSIESLPSNMTVCDDCIDGIEKISSIEPSFDLKKFLTSAGDVFVLVSEDFAKGNKDALSELVSTAVLKTFKEAIDERAEKGHVQTTEIRAVTNSEIVNVSVKSKIARIEILFSAEQVNATHDDKEKLVSGNLAKISTTKSAWVFERKLGSADRGWTVCEIKK